MKDLADLFWLKLKLIQPESFKQASSVGKRKVEAVPFPPPPVPERRRNSFGMQAHPQHCNLLITQTLMSWRQGESEYSGLLKTRNLLIFREAKNAENGKIAPNWNVSGTRTFQFSCQFCGVLLQRRKTANREKRFEPPNPPRRSTSDFTCPGSAFFIGVNHPRALLVF